MRTKINKIIYTLSGLIVTLIGLVLLHWGISNRTFPDYSATQIIAGKATNTEVRGWKISFNVEGYDDKFSYYRHYGNFNLVRELLINREPEVELVVDNTGNAANSKVYEISIDGKKITDFSEKKSNHTEYTKSVYIFSVVLFLIGCFGVFLGISKKSFVAQRQSPTE